MVAYQIHPLEKLCPGCGLVKPLIAWDTKGHRCLCCHADEQRSYWRSTHAKELPPEDPHPMFAGLRFGKAYNKRSAAIGREVRNHK